MANTCYERTYIEIASSQKEPVICTIRIYDAMSETSQVFLEDTLKPRSRNSFFSKVYGSSLYPNKKCTKPRKVKYSDFPIFSEDVVCPAKSNDRVYYYPKLSKMSREKNRIMSIYFESLKGDTLFYKQLPLNDFLSKKNEEDWIVI